MKLSNGHVTQSALDATTQSGSEFYATVEGVVVGILFPDDEKNRSKVEVEYDVDVTSVYGLGRLRNVPRADIASGADDGDDNILRAADAQIAGGEWVPDGTKGKTVTPRYESTGDRVLVQFINGNPDRPVIIGVLTHFKTRMRGAGQPLKDVNGKVIAGMNEKKRIRRTRHRGTELVMDDTGNVTVNFAKTPDQNGKDTDDKKKLTLNIGDFEIRIDNSSSPTTCEFKVKGGNVILKFTKDGFEVGASGLEPMVLGNKLTTLLTDFISAYNAHQHTGNMGAPTPMIPDAMVGKQVQVISDWAKVSKAKP